MRPRQTAIILIMLLLCSCAAPIATPTAPAGAVYATDALGRTVTLPQPPQRIATAGRGVVLINSALYLFPQAPARTAALGRGAQDADRFLALLDPDLAQKTLLERDVSAEQILPARPDLVLLKTSMAETLGRSLEDLGIPVFYLDLETPEAFLRDVAALGYLLDDAAHAEQVRAFYQARLDRLAQAVGGLDAAARPRVLVLQYSIEGGTANWKVPPAGWMQTTMVELAGGTPIWKDAVLGGGWVPVNLEQIAAWDPDHLFVIQYQGNARETAAGLAAQSPWPALRAVQAGRVHPFPQDLVSWDQPDPRWILGLSWMAQRLHPQRCPFHMEEEALLFFTQVYRLDEATVRAALLPLLRERSDDE